MSETYKWYQSFGFKLMVVGLMLMMIMIILIPSAKALSGNSNNPAPWITSSPVTYHISDSNPTGSSINSSGLVLSMDMETLRNGKMKNFAGTTSDDGSFNNLTSYDCGVRGKSEGFVSAHSSYIKGDSEIMKDNNMTFSIWIAPNALIESSYFISSGYGRMDIYSNLYHSTITMQFFNGATFCLCGKEYTFTVNRWTMITGTKSNITGLSLYSNGLLVAQVNTTIARDPILALGNEVSIGGGYPYGGVPAFAFYDGLLDEPLVFQRVLSPQEIRQLYNDTFTQYNIQTGTHYSYQAIQNQTTLYPAWSVKSNAPNVTIDSLGKVMGYWEQWQNGTYWINVSVQNVNGCAWQNYSIIIIPNTTPITTAFVLTDQMIIGLIFFIMCTLISFIGYTRRITLIPIIVFVVALFALASMMTTFSSVVYIPLLFMLVLGLIPFATWRH